MHDVQLAGCRSQPLASYLSALGVLRLVHEQAGLKGESVSGWWTGGTFTLRSPLDGDELVRFLTERYRPTPLITPWNGGGGFFRRYNKSTGRRDVATSATKVLDRVAESAAERLAPLRSAIHVAREILDEQRVVEAPKGPAKHALVETLRDRLPDVALQWLDATVVLGDDELKFPPLIGSGGNDGNLDFATNFHQRLADVFDFDSGAADPASTSWLRSGLFGTATPRLLRATIGQFGPGSVGGVNQGVGFEGSAIVNPWTFLLMLEGAVFLAGAATRRLESRDPAALAFPFTVRTLGVGAASAAFTEEATARHEVWMPLWDRPATARELRRLFAEGRAQVGSRAAKTGIDFARSITTLGIDRGLSAFVRYGFHQRNGKAYFAVPLEVWPVAREVQTDLVADIERWVDRLHRAARGPSATNSLIDAVGRIQERIHSVLRERTPARVQTLLVALGSAERCVARSRSLREAAPPVPPLPLLGDRWARDAGDASAEFWLAAGLVAAGVRRRITAASGPDLRDRLRFHPPGPRSDRSAGSLRGRWLPDDKSTTWTGGDLVDDLLRLVRREEVEAGTAGGAHSTERAAPAGDVATRWTGGPSGCARTFRYVRLEDLVVFVQRSVDDAHMRSLIPGISLVDPRELATLSRPESSTPMGRAASELPLAFRILALAHHRPRLPSADSRDRDRAEGAAENRDDDARRVSHERLPRTPGLVRLAAAGHVERALQVAFRRLRGAGFALAVSAPPPLDADRGRRYAAALAFPLSQAQLGAVEESLRPVERPVPSQETQDD